MDPLTLLIIGVAAFILSIPTNSYALAGTSIAFMFMSAMLYLV